MDSGFYKSMSMKDYHAAEGLSKSGLSDLAISPAHYRARKLEPVTFAAANLGTAVHLLVLEPEKSDRIVTAPKDVLGKNGTKNTTAYREWEGSQSKDALILSPDEYDAAHCMAEAVFDHPRHDELLKGGNAEVSAFWQDGNGITRKTRPDYLNLEYAVNLKTAISAEPSQFGKQAYNLHYHWDAAWCTDIMLGLGCKREYAFLVVEKSAPWAVACYSVPQEIIDMARNEIAPLLVKYRACLEYDKWPAYSDQIEPLMLPKWATHKKED